MDIVLASGSPRRKELLETLGLDFAVVPAKGEEIAPRGAGPAETVEALSRAKAEEVAKGFANALIIAADTIVWADGRILGKPKDETDAKAMLHLLSDNTHEVYTGVTVMYGGKIVVGSECTKVFFRKLSEGEIDRYVQTGEPMDKAGAYGIQGMGGLFVTGIDGDYYGVMGLPICMLHEMLWQVGCDAGTEKQKG